MTFRTVLLRLDISVRLALDIPFANREARSARSGLPPQRGDPKTAVLQLLVLLQPPS